MIFPEYDSSEEEIISSTKTPGRSTLSPSTSSVSPYTSSSAPCIVPEISVKMEDAGFLKGVDVEFWLMLIAIYFGLWLGMRAIEIIKGNRKNIMCG